MFIQFRQGILDLTLLSLAITVKDCCEGQVPRVHRQSLLQRLAGQYTALQLHAQHHSLESGQMTDELVKESFRLAEAQEGALFKKCSSKQV